MPSNSSGIAALVVAGEYTLSGKDFDLIVGQVIQMLVQNLVVVFDGMMGAILAARREKAGVFP
jgi:hypothetical protein